MSSRIAGLASLFALAMCGCCKKPAALLPAPRDGDPPASSVSAIEPAAPHASRCVEPASSAIFTLGKDSGSDSDDSLPFAVEVGDGVAYAGGFAVGALAPDSRGAAAVVVTMGPAGESPKVVSLGTAHGDTPPPRVAASDTSVIAALLEAGASTRRLRLARVDGQEITWGPSFEQGRDESLAYDLALGETRGVVTWDDDATDPDRGVIRVASFVASPLGAPTTPRTISSKDTDAETPRIVARPGGFWIVWIARHPESADEEARGVGEASEFRWLEAMPLDQNATPTGPSRRLTPETGHVLTYDLEPVDAGGAVVAYRDDDVPSGSMGGVVLRVVLRPDGVGESMVLADRHVGVGAPTLLPGWLAVSDAADETRLARLLPGGDLADRLESEPVLGRGEPIAARGDSILVSRPRGIGVRLFVATCHAGEPIGVASAVPGARPAP